MKVLFATDGNKQGDAAAEMFKSLKLGDGDSVHVISVVDMAVPMAVDVYGGYLPDTSELERVAVR
jgi:nucleotide-binding universal stress UspA family protein